VYAVSAKTGDNVVEVFISVARELVRLQQKAINEAEENRLSDTIKMSRFYEE